MITSHWRCLVAHCLTLDTDCSLSQDSEPRSPGAGVSCPGRALAQVTGLGPADLWWLSGHTQETQTRHQGARGPGGQGDTSHVQITKDHAHATFIKCWSTHQTSDTPDSFLMHHPQSTQSINLWKSRRLSRYQSFHFVVTLLSAKKSNQFEQVWEDFLQV